MLFLQVAVGLTILNVLASPDAPVGRMVPLDGAAPPAHWMIADGTPIPCTKVPKLCEADPFHVSGDKNWVLNAKGMVVDRTKNTKQTIWIVKVE